MPQDDGRGNLDGASGMNGDATADLEIRAAIERLETMPWARDPATAEEFVSDGLPVRFEPGDLARGREIIAERRPPAQGPNLRGPPAEQRLETFAARAARFLGAMQKAGNLGIAGVFLERPTVPTFRALHNLPIPQPVCVLAEVMPAGRAVNFGTRHHEHFRRTTPVV
ncbi:MAG: hypothetical protein ACYCZU_14265 [Devosia sp.]